MIDLHFLARTMQGLEGSKDTVESSIQGKIIHPLQHVLEHREQVDNSVHVDKMSEFCKAFQSCRQKLSDLPIRKILRFENAKVCQGDSMERISLGPSQSDLVHCRITFSHFLLDFGSSPILFLLLFVCLSSKFGSLSLILMNSEGKRDEYCQHFWPNGKVAILDHF